MTTMTFDPAADPLLRPAEVAERVGVRPETVLRWIRARQIPAIRLGPRGPGGHYRIRTSDLNAFIARRTTGTDEEPF